MAPHDDDAGDHTTGRGPSADSSQPLASAVAARPDALLLMLTKTQVPPDLASLPPLKLRASAVSRSPFSGDVATLTWMQPLPFPPDDDAVLPLVHPPNNAMATRRPRKLRNFTGPPSAAG